jgi:hypothetical protein
MTGGRDVLYWYLEPTGVFLVCWWLDLEST